MASIQIGLCFGSAVPSHPAVRRLVAASDFLVFPEMVDSGYAALKAGARPHHAGDAVLRTFADASRTLTRYCIAGSVYFDGGTPSPSNTSFVFHRGRLVHRYDKIHLFRPGKDHRYFRPGKTMGTFTASLPQGRVRCGVVICYDLRFPELPRAMALRGLDVLFVPARWPVVRDDAWRTLLKARAIENQIFVVGCNALGKEGGPSYVFDPMGRLLYAGRINGRTAHAVTLDLSALAEARRLHENLKEAVVLRSLRIPKSVKARRTRG
jgi:predicted amidohydrolase